MEILRPEAESEHHLLFGDKQEFSYQDCIEHYSADGQTIQEADVLFKDIHSGASYGLRFIFDPVAEPRFDMGEKAIYGDRLDPELVLRVLGMNSQTIRSLAQEIDD